MALGARLRAFKPGVFCAKQRQNIGVKRARTIQIVTVGKGERIEFGGTGINPGANQVHGVHFAAVSRNRVGKGAHGHNRSVAVGFFNVELPAGGHAIVAQARPQLGILPIAS